MEKKVATLDVYVSDDYRQSSHLDTADADSGRYVIRLNPLFFGQVNWEERKHPWHSFAHELGHFLAELAHRPSHNDLLNMLYGKLVPREMEAWRIAHEILPEPVMPAVSPVERAALGQYAKGDGER